MKGKLLIYAVSVLFIGWLLVLPFRSFIYVSRIYSEFKTGKQTYKPEISACTSTASKSNNFEDERFLNYNCFEKTMGY